MSVAAPLLFRSITAEYKGSGTILLLTDLPASPLTIRESAVLPYSAVRVALPPTALSGTTRGRIFRVSVAGGPLTIYRIGLYVRKLGRTPSDWFWHWIQTPGSEDAYADIHVPIPETPEPWQQIAVPVPETPEAWDEFPAPLPPSPDEQHWHNLPMDE